MLGPDALWHLPCPFGALAASASSGGPVSQLNRHPEGRETVHFGFGTRPAALVMVVLGLALGGCGTLGGGLKSESLLAATSAPTDATDPANPVAAALAPEQQPTGGGVRPHARA